eukprot:88182_1
MGTTFSDNPNSDNVTNTIPDMDHDTDWLNDIPETLTDSHQILQLTILMIGDSNTGKSSIIKQYISNSFSNHYIPTKNITANTYWFKNNNIDLMFYDIPGSELTDLNHLCTQMEWICTHGINGFIAVYDVNNIRSYLNMKYKLNKLLKIWYNKHSVKIPTLILGNKIDKINCISSKKTTDKIHKSEVIKFCENNKYNQRYDIDRDILYGYQVLVDGYLRKYQQMINMTREVLLSGKTKKIPTKVNTLCLLYIFNAMKCTMITEEISAKNHYQIVQCIESKFIDIVIDRYDETMFDGNFA